MKSVIDIAIPALTFALLTAAGMDLTRRDFARVRQQPALLAAGLFLPVLVLPPIALGLTWVFDVARDVRAGVLLVATCPIGGISNTYSYLARASTALSVSLTGLSCLCASFTIPLIGRSLEYATGETLDFRAPVPMLLAQLSLMLALPVATGMWIRNHFPEAAERHRPALQRLAFVGIGLVLLLVIAASPGEFLGGLSSTAPLAAVFIAVSMAVGWLTATALGGSPGDRFTFAAEFGTRNVAVAAAIAITLLGRVEFALFATVYFLTELPLMLMAIGWFRRRS